MFFQRKPKFPQVRNPFSDEASLGNVLIKMKALTKEQLHTAIGRKAYHDDMLLGALLREMGFVDDEQVANALKVQAKLRKGDSGEAAMLMLEMRTDAYCKGEECITKAIEVRKQDARDRGEASGLWTIPLSPLKV